MAAKWRQNILLGHDEGAPGICPEPLVNAMHRLAARPGFEPGSKDSKSFVLPLHHRAMRYLIDGRSDRSVVWRLIVRRRVTS